jgi:PilZ domain
MLFKGRRHKKTERPASEERRREPRTEDLNQLTLEPQGELPPGIGRGVYYAQTQDASASGLKVEADSEFPAGTRVLIKFNSPKTRKIIQAEAVVKWVEKLEGGRGFRMGLEFVATSVETILDLLEHIYKA